MYIYVYISVSMQKSKSGEKLSKIEFKDVAGISPRSGIYREGTVMGR